MLLSMLPRESQRVKAPRIGLRLRSSSSSMASLRSCCRGCDLSKYVYTAVRMPKRSSSNSLSASSDASDRRCAGQCEQSSHGYFFFKRVATPCRQPVITDAPSLAKPTKPSTSGSWSSMSAMMALAMAAPVPAASSAMARTRTWMHPLRTNRTMTARFLQEPTSVASSTMSEKNLAAFTIAIVSFKINLLHEATISVAFSAVLYVA